MVAPTKLNLKIYQGSTFRQILRWESSTKVYVPITGISKSAPMVVTAPAHGMPVGWRAKITNAGGMKEVNTLDYNIGTSVATNTVTFNQVNSLGFTTYTTGGVLEYNQPTPLNNLTARMQIREKVTSTSFIHEMTTQNGGIIFDNTNKTITLLINSATTTGFNFNTAIYLLEFQDTSSGDTIPFATGSISLQREVTR